MFYIGLNRQHPYIPLHPLLPFFVSFLQAHSVDQEVPDHVLKEIAINILACFAHFDDLAASQLMIDRLPALSTVLSPRYNRKRAIEMTL